MTRCQHERLYPANAKVPNPETHQSTMRSIGRWCQDCRRFFTIEEAEALRERA